MLNTALNKADLIYLLTQQEKLDKALKADLSITESDWINMHMEHRIALKVELHEFINACYRPWKYWKRKDMNMDEVLEEAIDVIHFAMLLINKSTAKTEFLGEVLADDLSVKKQLQDRGAVKRVMFHLSNGTSSVEDTLGYVLQILDYYGFDVLDILNAYKKKNAKNFERIVEGY